MPGFHEFDKHFSDFAEPHKKTFTDHIRLMLENAKIKRDSRRMTNILNTCDVIIFTRKVCELKESLNAPVRAYHITDGNYDMYLNKNLFEAAVMLDRIIIAQTGYKFNVMKQLNTELTPLKNLTKRG